MIKLRKNNIKRIKICSVIKMDKTKLSEQTKKTKQKRVR